MARGGRGRWCERLTLQSPRQPRSQGSTARPPAPWASSRPHSASSSAAASLSRTSPADRKLIRCHVPTHGNWPPRGGNGQGGTLQQERGGRRGAGGMAAQGRGCRRLSSKENAAVSRTNRTEPCSYDTCPEKAMCHTNAQTKSLGQLLSRDPTFDRPRGSGRDSVDWRVRCLLCASCCSTPRSSTPSPTRPTARRLATSNAALLALHATPSTPH